MRLGRPIPELILSSAEQEMLQRWAHRPTSAQAPGSRRSGLCGDQNEHASESGNTPEQGSSR